MSSRKNQWPSKQPTKRRKFHGNRHTKTNKDKQEDEDCRTTNEDKKIDRSRSRSPSPGPSSRIETPSKPRSIAENSVLSRSEKKIMTALSIPHNESDARSSSSDSDDDSDSDSYNKREMNGYRIIDIGILNKAVTNNVVCRFCKAPVSLIETDCRGLGSTYNFVCNNNCEQLCSFPSCPTEGNLQRYTVNKRAIFSMRCIGGDRAELETFCGVMDIPSGISKSTVHILNSKISEAAISSAASSMSDAAKHEYNNSESINDTFERDIDVSLDGTWMTRGHSSNIGTTCIIGLETGKVLDSETLSKQCKGCDWWNNKDKTTQAYKDWQANHICTINHTGSSGSMEATAAVAMFGRSKNLHSLRYTRYIGDGDSSSFQTVFNSKPYDKDIEKIECVGHVQKRMGSRLRKLKDSYKGQKLSDGKPIGGKNRLTDVKIDAITTYYGNAIRANKHDLKSMREAIWAIYFHYRSSDEDPTHHFCNKSWCRYLQTPEEERKKFKHTTGLPRAVMDAIRPTFKALVETNLLKKCLEGYTQNSNESLNSVIWKICPKIKNHGLFVVKAATALAICLYNDGAKGYMKVLDSLGLSVGNNTKRFCEMKDRDRIYFAKRKTTQASLECRRQKRRERKAANEKNDDKSYSKGCY